MIDDSFNNLCIPYLLFNKHMIDAGFMCVTLPY